MLYLNVNYKCPRPGTWSSFSWESATRANSSLHISQSSYPRRSEWACDNSMHDLLKLRTDWDDGSQTGTSRIAPEESETERGPKSGRQSAELKEDPEASSRIFPIDVAELAADDPAGSALQTAVGEQRNVALRP